MISLSRSMFGSKHSSRGDSSGYGGYGSQWTGPFLSPTSVDDLMAYNPLALTAFACAVRLVSETIGIFVMRVYEGDSSQKRVLLDDPRAALLQDGAEGYATSMDTWSDVSASVELCGNGFIWKGRRKKGGQVTELYSFPADNTCVYVNDQGAKVVEARIGGETYDVTKDVIHVRNFSPDCGVSGVATPVLHRSTLRGQVTMQEFKGRYFSSDSTPNLVLSNPGNLTPEQRAELRQSWNARHQGPDGDKTAVLWNGMTVQQLTANLEQSQLSQLMTADVLQVAQMMRIYPPNLLAAVVEQPLPAAEVVTELMMRLTLLHRVRRIERALSADRDLFPDRRSYARFDVAEFTRGDTATIVSKVHQLTQVGVLSANEGRNELGYPPSSDPEADKLLQTPVGGAPNSQLALFPNGNGVHAELSPAVDPA